MMGQQRPKMRYTHFILEERKKKVKQGQGARMMKNATMVLLAPIKSGQQPLPIDILAVI
jgi:hypothetical protein